MQIAKSPTNLFFQMHTNIFPNVPHFYPNVHKSFSKCTQIFFPDVHKYFLQMCTSPVVMCARREVRLFSWHELNCSFSRKKFTPSSKHHSSNHLNLLEGWNQQNLFPLLVYISNSFPPLNLRIRWNPVGVCLVVTYPYRPENSDYWGPQSKPKHILVQKTKR